MVIYEFMIQNTGLSSLPTNHLATIVDTSCVQTSAENARKLMTIMPKMDGKTLCNHGGQKMAV